MASGGDHSRLHADVESGWFGAWLVVHHRLGREHRSRWGEVVLVDPGGEGFGEGSVVAAGVVEVLGGVDEGGGWWGVPGRPGVPGVESVEALFDDRDSVGVAVEAAGESLVDLAVLLQPVLFLTELLALVEEGLGAAGAFVERSAGGGNIVDGFGERVAC